MTNVRDRCGSAPTRLGRSLAFMGALALMACVEDIDTQPPLGERVQALFDPSLRILPTPTDLAKSAETGLLEVPVADAETRPAQAALDRYLNTLDGYPVSSTASFCLSGAVDPATLRTALKVLALPREASGAPVDVSDEVRVGEPAASAACPVLGQTACDPSASATSCADGERCVALSSADAKLGRCAKSGFRVSITPTEPWERATSYALLLGDGVRDLQGQPVIRASSFEIVAGGSPLCVLDAADQACTYNYSALIETAVEDQLRAEQPDLTGEAFDEALRTRVLASASQLERLRQATRQLLQAGATVSLEPEDVLLAWSFSTTSQAEAVFDPALGVIPGPANDLLLGPDGTVNIPPSAGESADESRLREGLNTLEGFSTTATHFTTFLGDLNDETVKSGENLVLLRLGADPGLVVPPPVFRYDAANKAVTMTPAAPLREETQYAVLLLSRRKFTSTTGGGETLTEESGGGLADTNGRRVIPSPTFALARSPGPLVDDAGKSQVSVLSDAQASALEPLRAAYDRLFTGVEALGLAREDIVLVWTFTTQPITAPLVGLRALTYAKLGAIEAAAGASGPALLTVDASRTVAPEACHSTDPRATCWPTPTPPEAIATFVAGAAFTSWNALDPASGLLDPDREGTAAPRSEPIPLYVAIPKPPPCLPDDTCAPFLPGFSCTTGEEPKVCRPTSGWPVVVFQHGLRASRGQWFAVADTLARFGLASVAFDVVYHGTRSACSVDEQCANPLAEGPAAFCDPSGAPRRCCVGEGDAKVCGPQFLRLDENGIPLASGVKFLDAANPFALKSNMLQHVIDSVALLRALSLDAEAGLLGPDGVTPLGLDLDETRVHFAGHSLGAILGAPVMAIDPLNQGDGPKRAFFNVAGAPVVRIFQDTQYPEFQTIVAGLLSALGVEPGSLEALRLFHVLQWVVDPVDPANFAPYVNGRRLPNALAAGSEVPAKDLLVQIATNDLVIPGARQAALAGWLGADVSKSSFDTLNHVFLLVPRTEAPAPDPAGLRAAAQLQMATFLATGAVCTPDVTAGTCSLEGSN